MSASQEPRWLPASADLFDQGFRCVVVIGGLCMQAPEGNVWVSSGTQWIQVDWDSLLDIRDVVAHGIRGHCDPAHSVNMEEWLRQVE